MSLIKVFAGSFGGATLFENPSFVSPNEVRAAVKRAKGRKYAVKVEMQEKKRSRRADLVVEEDELFANAAFRDKKRSKK